VRINDHLDAAARLEETLTGVAGARLEVGGVPAFNVDYEDTIKNSLGKLVLSVCGAPLIVLSLVFRSVLIPLKAVALNLLTVAAAFGAVASVFQHALGARLMGLPRPIDGGFPILPQGSPMRKRWWRDSPARLASSPLPLASWF
jgi:RND superfamily putative drug exporter